MNPFVYPTHRHSRQQRPGTFSDYRKYKPFLRIEFERKCVYCRRPDTINAKPHDYGVDHYAPKGAFPKLAVTYSNLFYCCNNCNALKGEYWPSPAQLTTHFIPNPCDHSMSEHVRFRGREVIASSDAGRQLVDLLDLNDPDAVQFREFIVTSIDLFRDKEREARAKLARLRRQRSRLKKAFNRDSEIAELEAVIPQIKTNLDRLAGAL